MNASDYRAWRDAYGEGPCKTGLCLALVDPVTRELLEWPKFPPIPPEDIEWGDVAPHYGIHQFDVVRQDLRTTTRENAA